MRKVKPINKEDIHIGCLTCSTVGLVADLDMIICVGFGSAQVTCNGAMFYDGEQDYINGNEPRTLRTIEAEVQFHPNRDWRLVMYGPLHGETYQRQRLTKKLQCGPLPDSHLSADKQFAWVMIESNQGFA